MNGGRIEISIAAVYTEFEKAMKEAEQKAGPGGAAVAEQFSDGFQRGSTKYLDRLANDFGKKMTAAVGGMAITGALKAALDAAAEGASVGDALAAGLKSTPFVGSLVSIGESIGKIIGQTAAKEAAMAETVAAQQRLNKMNQDKVAAANKAREEAQAYADEEQKLEDDARRATEKSIQTEYDLRKEYEIRQLEAAGKAREAIMAKAALKEAQILREMNEKVEGAKSEAEGESLMRIAQQRIKNLRAETQIELSEKEKADQERIAKARDVEVASRIKAEQEILDAAYAKAIKRDEELAKAEAQGIAAQSQTGSIGTSFGTFKFSAYSDVEKKATDKTMVVKLGEISKNTERMVDEVKRGGTGGFQ